MADEAHLDVGAFALGERKVLAFEIFDGPLDPMATTTRAMRDVSGKAFRYELRRAFDAPGPAVLLKTSEAGHIVVTGTFNPDRATNTQRVEVTITRDDTRGLAAGEYYQALWITTSGEEGVLASGVVPLARRGYR